MKKVMVLIGALLICYSIADGQDTVKNKIKPDLHNYHFQIGDPYNPGVMGFASFVIPGLGQIIEGETVRGICFLGAIVGLNVYRRFSFSNSGSSGYQRNLLIAKLGIHIWSMFDAVHMAKVNNVEFRNQNKTAINISLVPYLGSDEYYKFNNDIPVGMTLLISF
jgi:TM2 domain-containing membrane protein YozV